jgi:hypothetical protein
MLIHVAMYLASAPDGSSASTGLDNFYYILASIALVGGFLEGMRRFLIKQRKKWVDEGKAKAETLQAQKDNSMQLKANTEAIAALTKQMGEFIANVHSELNGLGKRIARLEHFTGNLKE